MTLALNNDDVKKQINYCVLRTRNVQGTQFFAVAEKVYEFEKARGPGTDGGVLAGHHGLQKAVLVARASVR